MKTAEEMYMYVQDIECPNVNNLILPEEWQINAMKAYAKEVAEQALKDAADGAKVKGIPCDEGGYLKMVDCDSILSTPIVTP